MNKANRPTVKVNFVNIPQELKANAAFCVWRSEKRNGAKAKIPYNPVSGSMAKVNDPSTFTDFGTAMKAYALGGWDGIGYRVSEGIGAIDIDHCIREDGSLNDVAASILGIFSDAYFERSPSGSGLRGFFRLSPDFAYDKTVYYINNRKHGLEMYLPGTTHRFVTVTGDVFRQGSVARNDGALQTVLDTFMRRASRVAGSRVEPCSYLTDDQVIAHASASESGEKFKALYAGNWEEGYDSQSDADMALVSMLAFWCGNVEEQIDRIFRTSGLFRPKWDRRTGDSTYGQITIRNAVSTSSTIYIPLREAVSADDEFDNLDGVDQLDDTDEMDGSEGKEEHPAFRPDLLHVTKMLADMQPHTNPRYQRDEIGMLKPSESLDDVRSAIRRISVGMTGYGNSAHPFDEIYDYFTISHGNRCAIVLADGQWGHESNAISAAKRCHKAGIDIAAIGFGTANSQFLDAISSRKDLSILTDQSRLTQSFGTIAQSFGVQKGFSFQKREMSQTDTWETDD